MPSPTDSSESSVKKKESGYSGKRRKVNDESESGSSRDRVSFLESCGSCAEDDEAISAEKELCEDRPADAIGSVFAKNLVLLSDAKNLDSSVSAGVSAICNDQNGIICDILTCYCQQPLDSLSFLSILSKLERKTAEFFPFTDVLPSAYRSNILEFVDVTVKLRRSLSLFRAKSVHAPTICDIAGELVKINLEINMMIRCSAVCSVHNKVTEVLKAQNEEVVKMVKLFHEHKVSTESLMKVLISISEINDRFFPLIEFLPKELPSKLLGMSVMFCKLWHLGLP